MKRMKITITACLFLLCLLAFGQIRVHAEIRFDRASVNVLKGSTRKLHISCKGKYTVTTTDSSIATVSHKGKVKGRKPGDCEIVVVCGAESARIPVHVLSSLRSGNILLIGHRGYQEKYPENTISSFKGALDYGADGVEFDVVWTRSGDLLVFHDGSLSRVCKTRGSVHNLNAQTRLKYRVRHGGKKDLIPTLEEALSYVHSRNAIAFMHLKMHGSDFAGSRGDYIAQKLKETGMLGHCVVFGSSTATLAYFKEHYPEVTTGYFYGGSSRSEAESLIRRSAANGATWFYIYQRKVITYGLVQYAHQFGMKIGLYRTSKKKEVLDLMDYGAEFAMLYHKVI